MIKGYQTILDALSKRLDKNNISEKERKSITDDMISVADKIAQADLQNKKFLERMGMKILWGLGIAVAVVGAGLGINAAIKAGDDDLPQLADNKDDDDSSYS